MKDELSEEPKSVIIERGKALMREILNEPINNQDPMMEKFGYWIDEGKVTVQADGHGNLIFENILGPSLHGFIQDQLIEEAIASVALDKDDDGTYTVD